MVTTTKKCCGSGFYSCLSIFYKDHNKECIPTKYEQFWRKYVFEEILTQRLKIYAINSVRKEGTQEI